MIDEDSGERIEGNLPCPHCDSSDAVSVYEKEDDEGNEYNDGFCFSCNEYINPKLTKEFYEHDFESYRRNTVRMNYDLEKEFDKIQSLEYRGWAERKLPKQLSEFFGVHTELEDDNKTVKYRYYPITRNGNIVGYKKRIDAVKKAKNKGDKTDSNPFFVIGENKASCELFGQRKFRSGGKFLIIASGEEDVLAWYRAMNNDKYEMPIVCCTVGEGSTDKQIKQNFEWVTSFEKVIIAMDNDKAGKTAAEKIAKILKPSQAHICTTKRKDACEHSKHGEFEHLKNAFWNAVNHGRYSPAGIVGSSQTWEALVNRARVTKVSLPDFAEDLQDMMKGGLALGEITTLAAASSTGKTSIVNEFLYHWIMQHANEYKVGVVSLESDLGELTENLMSLHLNKKLANMDDNEKLDYYENDSEALEKHKELMCMPDGSDRFNILDHQGDVADGDLKSKVEYLVKGLGCKIIILDPLTLALSGEGNEGMDLFMSWLLRFVKREQVCHINVVHVRKNGEGSKANSRGAEISEESIKGSGSIFQVSMNNILIMRDKMADDPRVRNTTKVMVSKARRTGNTGPAGFWYYDNETSRLEKGIDPQEYADYDEEVMLFDEGGAFNNDNPDDFKENPKITHEEKEELVFNKPDNEE